MLRRFFYGHATGPVTVTGEVETEAQIGYGLSHASEAMAVRVKGILFDLGETLLDFGKVDITSVFEAGAKLAYDYLAKRGQALPSFVKFHRRQLRAIRWSYLKSRFTRREFNSLDILGRLGQQMGHKLNTEQTLELAWLWYQPLSRLAVVETGLLRMLEGLRDQGLKLGLVSNTFVPAEVLDRHLEMEGLRRMLPVRVYSCQVGFRKPHPEIFRMASEQLGVDAGATMFVGDSPVADIFGANRAGMISVLKDPGGRHANDSAAAHRITRLAELPALVAGYNAPERSCTSP